MNTRLFKIIWAPTIGSWAILWAIYLDSVRRFQVLTQPPLLVVAYMLCSAYLAYKFYRSVSTSSESDSVTTVSQSYASLWFLLVAAIISLTGTALQQTGNYWLVAAVAGIAVIIEVIGGLGSYSDEQLTTGFEARSLERSTAISIKEEYSQEFLNLSKAFLGDPDINNEIERIRSVLNYSSFFRSSQAAVYLAALRDPSKRDKDHVIETLRGIS
jgi:hypothetical protein